jgi:hypothetical protein
MSLDEGKLEKYAGKEKDAAGHVYVIIDIRSLLQNFFSDGEKEKKVQK